MALEEGNIVIVAMTANNWFPWQTGPSFKARFVSAPQGPGDTFKFVIPGSERELELNGNSTALIGLYLDRGPDS